MDRKEIEQSKWLDEITFLRFREAVRKALACIGKTQSDLARECGLTSRSVSYVFARSRLRISRVRAYAVLYAVERMIGRCEHGGLAAHARKLIDQVFAADPDEPV